MDMRLDKRLTPRRNMVINASVVFDNGRTEITCFIRNLSGTGAELEFATVESIPEGFDLLTRGHRPEHCRVVWRTSTELGVEFIQRD